MPVECAGLASGSSDYVTQSTAEYRNLFKGAKVHQLCGDISPDYPYYHRNAVPKSLMKSMRRHPSLSFCAIPSTRRIRITCTMCGTGGRGSSLHPLKKWSLRQIRGGSGTLRGEKDTLPNSTLILSVTGTSFLLQEENCKIFS